MDQTICEQFQIDIVDYIDGTLVGERLAALKQHLESCEACSRLVEEMRMILGETAALTDPIPEDLHERIMGRVTKERPAGRLLRFPLRKLTVAAAALALLIGAGSLFASSFGAKEDAMVAYDMAYTAENAKAIVGYSIDAETESAAEECDDAAPMETCQEKPAVTSDAAAQKDDALAAFAAIYELYMPNLPAVLQPYEVTHEEAGVMAVSMWTGDLLAAVPMAELDAVLEVLDANGTQYESREADPDAEQVLFILHRTKE